MTSLLSSPPLTQPADPVESGAARRRPVLLLALLAGVVAAGSTLLVCSAVGMAGWFLSDAGAHGAPRDGMRTGAVAWLMAHGSGLTVDGTPVTVVPLGLTAMAAWTVWRVAHRLGEALWGHGPDVHRLGDGERDWTVPVGVTGFGVGYAGVALLTVHLVTAGQVKPDTSSVLAWCLGLTLALAGPGIAAGSGRAAIWAARLPVVVRHGAATARSILRWYLGLSALVVAGSFLLNLGEAANMVEQLGTTGGETAIFALVNLAFFPNAVLFGASFLAGPGFAVGGATLVSPSAVVLGPLPVFPLLAALPDTGTPPAWLGAVIGIPALLAALVTIRVQRRRPTLRWEEGALRGCGGGIVAGVGLAVLAALAGGAAGPGRMRYVGVFTFDLLVHAVTAFGLGGLVGGLLITWWQRRTSEPAPETLLPPA